MRTSLLLICLLLSLAAHAQPQSLKDYGLKGKVRLMMESTKDTLRLKKKEYGGYRETIVQFDERGNVVSRADTAITLTDMKIVSMTASLSLYTYNAGDQLAEQKVINRVFEAGRSGKPVSDTTLSLFTYEGKSLSGITTITIGNHREHDTSIVKLAYNDNRKLIARNWVKPGPQQHKDEKYTYNEHMVLERHDPYTGKLLTSVDTTHTYDRKEQTRTATFTIGEGFTATEYTLRFDSKDRLVEEIQDNSASISGPVRTTYTMFDAWGNYKKAITFRKRELPAITLRRIEYYP